MISIVYPVYSPTLELVALAERGWNILQQASDKLPDEQWVVVNNGGYVKEAAKYLQPRATTYYESEKPLGYAGAVNIGLRLAQHDHVVIASTDIEWVTPGFDLKLSLALSNLDHVGAIGVGYYGVDTPGNWVRKNHCWSCVALWALPMSVIRTVGLLDEEYTMYWDDTDLLFRIEQAGYSIYQTGNVMVIHQGGTTLHQDPQHQQKYEVNRQRFMRKHGVDGDTWKNIKVT